LLLVVISGLLSRPISNHFLHMHLITFAHFSWSLDAWFTLQPWRWRQYVPPKHQWTPIRIHGVTSQKIIVFLVTTVRIITVICNILDIKFIYMD
jgi:hypothetical protein